MTQERLAAMLEAHAVMYSSGAGSSFTEYILEKGEPQEVAMSFLCYPKIWDASYASCPWATVMKTSEVLEGLLSLTQSFSKLYGTGTLGSD